MLEIRFSIEGETQLARRLNKIGDGVKDFKPEFEKSVNFLKDFFGGEVFNTEGAILGEKWVGGPYYHKLQRTGRMRRSFDTKASKLSGEVWNAVDYFKYHQSRMPRRKLPRRIMMKLTSQLKDKIVQIFHSGIWNRINKSQVGI